jgi:hypothetical protein
MELRTTTSGSCLLAANGSYIQFQNIYFGTCASAHLYSVSSSTIEAIGNYAVSGNAGVHWFVDYLGYIQTSSLTVTYSNTPAFSSAHASGQRGGIIQMQGMTFTNGGTVTGPRWSAQRGAIIETGAGGASYIPGDVAGTPAQGAAESVIHAQFYGQCV